jgi:hypothetical protein
MFLRSSSMFIDPSFAPGSPRMFWNSSKVREYTEVASPVRLWKAIGSKDRRFSAMEMETVRICGMSEDVDVDTTTDPYL